MTRGGSRLVAVFVILTAVAVAVVVLWIVVFRKPRRVVHIQRGTTVLVAPPVTPLPRDSGPRNNPRPTSRRSGASTVAGSVTRRPGTTLTPRTTPTRPQKHNAPPKNRKTSTAKPKPQASSPPPSQPAPPSSPPPQQPVVTVPLPKVCTHLIDVNCS